MPAISAPSGSEHGQRPKLAARDQGRLFGQRGDDHCHFAGKGRFLCGGRPAIGNEVQIHTRPVFQRKQVQVVDRPRPRGRGGDRAGCRAGGVDHIGQAW